MAWIRLGSSAGKLSRYHWKAFRAMYKEEGTAQAGFRRQAHACADGCCGVLFGMFYHGATNAIINPSSHQLELRAASFISRRIKRTWGKKG